MTNSTTSQDRAHESARDLTKLIISLSSAIIAISATFVEKHTLGINYFVLLLGLSWGLLILSLLYGITAFITLVNTEEQDLPLWWALTRKPLRRAWIFFRCGIIVLSLYALIVSIIYAFELTSVDQTHHDKYCCPPTSYKHSRDKQVPTTQAEDVIDSIKKPAPADLGEE